MTEPVFLDLGCCIPVVGDICSLERMTTPAYCPYCRATVGCTCRPCRSGGGNG